MRVQLKKQHNFDQHKYIWKWRSSNMSQGVEEFVLIDTTRVVLTFVIFDDVVKAYLFGFLRLCAFSPYTS